MKLLTISRNRLEITRAQLRRPMMTIGRSPSCDVLLRAPGVRDIHFMVEWIGHGNFDPSQGAWSIVDISDAIGNTDDGEGLVLSDGPITLGDLVFECIDDALESHEEIGGQIQAALSSGGTEAALLEVVQIRSDSGAVEGVSHIPVPQKPKHKARSLAGVPRQLKVIWKEDSAERIAQIIVEEMPGAELFVRGHSISTRSAVDVKPNDLLRVRWKGRDFYIRFVAEVKAPKMRRAVFGDPLLRRISLAVISAGFMLLMLVRLYPTAENQTTPPQRIARVQIAEPEPPKPKEIPKPEPEPQPTLAEKKQEQKESAKTDTKPQEAAKASKARFNSQEGHAKAGLNSPAQVSDVNSVGILGALGKVAAKGKGVKAEKILNSGISLPSTNAVKPNIVLSAPPSGTVGTGKGGSPEGESKTDLSAASTTLKGAGKYDPSAVGPIAHKAGDTGFNIGTGAHTDGTSVNSGKGVGDMGAGEFSVVGGGLDRETVRRVIASYRGEIRTCYERALLAQSHLEGRVVYDWRISAEGSVTGVAVAKGTLNSQTLKICVQDVIRRMTFPRAANGRSTRVIYPFVFQSGNEETQRLLRERRR